MEQSVIGVALATPSLKCINDKVGYVFFVRAFWHFIVDCDTGQLCDSHVRATRADAFEFVGLEARGRGGASTRLRLAPRFGDFGSQYIRTGTHTATTVECNEFHLERTGRLVAIPFVTP